MISRSLLRTRNLKKTVTSLFKTNSRESYLSALSVQKTGLSCFSETKIDASSENLRGKHRIGFSLEQGQSMGDFEVLKKDWIEDYKMEMTMMKHKSLGTHWFHFDSEDLNNSFTFLFRTLPDDHTGKPHILEHTGKYN